ncbi:MAG: peptidylprolyl isomerase, partial [Planctomycetes bacterium]|nr:peptidylprolyl isomerase [Planctomycetota bacterium]
KRSRLVLDYLQSVGEGATQAELDRAVLRLQKVAEQQGDDWTEFVHRSGLDPARLRQQLAWEIGWTRFLEKHVTDENLQRYFEQHRREFDGSQVRVAHLLLRVASPQDPAAVAATIQRADGIRKQIVDGQLTFADAARQFSEAPTAKDGGAIGMIGRRGPMPEAFSAAAFALDAGQVSDPVVSRFGVHLIQSLEIVPGDKTWRDVRDNLQQAVTRYLFRWAADRQRPRATIDVQMVSMEPDRPDTR